MDFATRLNDARRDGSQKAKPVHSGRRKKFGSTNIGASEIAKDAIFGSDLPASQEVAGLRLAEFYLTQSDFERLLGEAVVLTITKLLNVSCPPAFAPPDEPNYAIIGIVARRGEFRQTPRGKSVIFSLTDLVYDIPFSASGVAFEKYYKIQPGTVIAILNPRVFPARDNTSRTVGIGVNVDECVLEVGRAKDFAFCAEQTKAKNRRCRNWVDTRHSEICDYHREARVQRARSSRPELNSAPSKLFAPRSGNCVQRVFKGGAVSWKTGIQPDFQEPPVGRVWMGSMPQGFDNSVALPMEKSRLEKKRREMLENEARIRKKLAARPNGYLLREFDQKGRLLEEQPSKPALKKVAKLPGEDSDSDLEIIY